jgi:hypothetical protein
MKLDVPDDYVPLLIIALEHHYAYTKKLCCVRTLDTGKPRIGSIGNRHRSLRSRYGR